VHVNPFLDAMVRTGAQPHTEIPAMTAPLAGKVALVTDAARGIGHAIAAELATARCEVAVNFYNGAHEPEVLCRDPGRTRGVRSPRSSCP
jgi:hypothetical protein